MDQGLIPGGELRSCKATQHSHKRGGGQNKGQNLPNSSSKHILQKTVWVGTFFQITSIRKYHRESYVYRVAYYVQDYKESSGNFSTSRREYCFFSGVLKLSTFYCPLFYSRSHWSVFRNQNFK